MGAKASFWKIFLHWPVSSIWFFTTIANTVVDHPYLVTVVKSAVLSIDTPESSAHEMMTWIKFWGKCSRLPGLCNPFHRLQKKPNSNNAHINTLWCHSWYSSILRNALPTGPTCLGPVPVGNYLHPATPMHDTISATILFWQMRQVPNRNACSVEKVQRVNSRSFLSKTAWPCTDIQLLTRLASHATGNMMRLAFTSRFMIIWLCTAHFSARHLITYMQWLSL